MDKPVPKDLKTKNLMLLMGTNPLPNYVAARLLCLPEKETRLHLVVTPQIRQADIHRRLIKLLGRDEFDEEHYIYVNSADPADIFTKVQTRVKKYPGSWGLHYTGGKKSMVVQTYKVFEDILRESPQPRVYSYLDANTLELIINTPSRTFKQYVHLSVPVRIQEILELHGRDFQSMNEEPFRPEFGETLVAYCQNAENRKAWLDWAASNLKRENGKDLNNTLAGKVYIPEQFPIIGGKTILELKEPWGKKAEDIAKWLHGQWLDDFIHAKAQTAAENANIHQVVSSLQPSGIVQFEVDVVAMQGYRLFAVSATTEDEKGLAKLKLFEAMVRARQMGGDEAKVALATFSENPEKLEKQVGEQLTLTDAPDANDWQSSARVFGIYDLPRLELHLEKWFKEL